QTRTGYSEEEVRSRAAALAEQLAAERIAAREAEAAARAGAAPEPTGPVLGLTAKQLIDELGLDRELAERAAAADDAELYALASTTGGWQGTALLDLATGTGLQEVRAAYFTGVTGGSEVGTPSGTEDLLQSLNAEKSQANYRLFEDDAALADVLASGSFDEWRIFLHPEQRSEERRVGKGVRYR